MSYMNKLGALASSLQSAQSEPPQPPRFEAVADRLSSLVATADSAVSRVRAVADRYGGPSPEAVDKSGGVSGPPSSLASRLESILDQINSQLIKLHDQISRIERF